MLSESLPTAAPDLCARCAHYPVRVVSSDRLARLTLLQRRNLKPELLACARDATCILLSIRNTVLNANPSCIPMLAHVHLRVLSSLVE